MAPRNMHHAVDREPHPKMLAGTAQSAILGGGNTNHRKDLHSAAIGARIRFQTEDSHWLAVWRVSGRYGIRCADNLRPFCASLDDRLILFAVGVSEDFVQLHTPPPVDHHLGTSVDCSSRRGAAKASWPATAESPDHRETQATIAKLVRSCGCAALLRMSRHRGAAVPVPNLPQTSTPKASPGTRATQGMFGVICGTPRRRGRNCAVGHQSEDGLTWPCEGTTPTNDINAPDHRGIQAVPHALKPRG